MRFSHALALTIIAGMPVRVGAEEPPARPEILTKLVDCRATKADVDRLACYDRQVAVLDEAERKRDLVMVDRAEIGRTRRTLFGLPLPSLKLFGSDAGNDQPEFASIDSVIKSARQTSGGCWAFVLDDDARWVQSDQASLSYTPKAGQHIHIRRAMLGNYLANIGQQKAVRVRRINDGQSATGYCGRG